MIPRSLTMAASLAALTFVLFQTGCGKKGTPGALSADIVPASTTNDPASATPADSAHATMPVGDLQTAIKTRDYNTAVTLALSQKPAAMTAEQAAALANQMRQLQQNLASAAAAGDPNAVAAAQRLREANMRH
jgi:hypothetical protein